jgi:hypothetical protein
VFLAMNKIANVENVICSVETMSRHADLYHYTNPMAFEGIVGSQTLWCSHYREMADTDEIRLMRDLLPRAVAPRMDAIVETLNRRTRRLWAASGRGAKTARDLVNSLYGATFDGKAHYSALEAYLFSFSTHAGGHVFDREHGISSQWESYAGPEGYCLVFDIREITQMLRREMDTRYWARLTLDAVRYADRPVEDIFPELVNASADTLRQFIDGVKVPEIGVVEFLAGATLLKGANYKSEREVRIVAIPGTTKMAKYAAKEYPDQFDATAPLPQIRYFADLLRRLDDRMNEQDLQELLEHFPRDDDRGRRLMHRKGGFVCGSYWTRKGLSAPSGYNPQTREIDAVISTGARVRRRDWDGEFDEVLDMRPQSVRLARLNRGTAVLDSHNWVAGVGGMLGGVVPGSARLEDGALVARIRFSRGSPLAQRIVQDLQDGLQNR